MPKSRKVKKAVKSTPPSPVFKVMVENDTLLAKHIRNLEGSLNKDMKEFTQTCRHLSDSFARLEIAANSGEWEKVERVSPGYYGPLDGLAARVTVLHNNIVWGGRRLKQLRIALGLETTDDPHFLLY